MYRVHLAKSFSNDYDIFLLIFMYVPFPIPLSMQIHHSNALVAKIGLYEAGNQPCEIGYLPCPDPFGFEALREKGHLHQALPTEAAK